MGFSVAVRDGRAALERELEEARAREANHRRLAEHIREKYLPDGVIEAEYGGEVPRLSAAGCATKFARASAWFWIHADGAEDARREVRELEALLSESRGGEGSP